MRVVNSASFGVCNQKLLNEIVWRVNLEPVMTLEFENPPFPSNIGLNSSFNNDADFTSSFDRVTSKTKKTSVISVARKKSFLKKNEEENREMSGRYSDDYDSYEDDFDSPDASKERRRRYSGSSRSRHSQMSEDRTHSPPNYRSKKASTRRDSFASYRSAYGPNRGPSKPKIKKSHSAASKLTSKTTGSDQSSMMRRVLSANRNKVSRLHNIVEELQQEIDELKSENKSLKRISHRQEKEIKKIDEEESSVPILLQRHSAEMRTLKERLRRNQDVLHKKERESHDRDKEIQKLQDKIKNYRELSQNKKLEERASLAKKLQNVENEIALKDKKILDLEKTLTLKDKMRQRDMKEQKDRYRQAKEELKRVQEDFRSLRERLQEKERELDEKNIYHQHIIQKKKKAVTFPALTSAISHDPALTTPVLRVEKLPDRKEKHPNVFLTNALSDSGSVITEEGKESVHTTVVSDTRSEKVAAADAITPSVFEADRRDKNEEARLRNEAEERRKLEEEERKRRAEEEDRKRKEEEEKRREKEEDERRKDEEEELRKLREEQERERKRKEDEDKQRLEEEEAETRRKKDLLLARMRAIDAGNEKTNDEITTETTAVDSIAVENKPKKLPIFLQSETLTKKESQQAKPTVTSLSEDDIFSDAGSDKKRSSARSKQSGYSYDFKQTVENLHHGRPAHASLENVKEAAADSTSDDLSFGGYKPTLGRRAAAKTADSKNKDELSFGGYNPSFGAKKDVTRKSSGLDFGSGNKFTTQKDQNGSISGEYKPTFGAASSKASATLPTSDIFGEGSGIARGRRPREFPGKGNTVFGDELLTNEVKATVSPPLFGDKSFTANNKSSYPWENKVDVARRTSSNKEQDDSLLPRRRNLQSIGKSAEKNIPVVDNALDDIDDEIEEVIL